MATVSRIPADDPNHDALIQTVTGVFSALSIWALCLRLYSRRLTAHQLFKDDYLVILAWIMALAQGAMFASGGSWSGSGHHISRVTVEQLSKYQKGYYADSFLQNGSLTLSKFAVIVQLHRIFRMNSRFRYTMYFLGTIVISWGVSSILAYALICIPIRSNWDPQIPHHCGDRTALQLAVPIPWIVTDFAILVSPLPVLKSLQMSLWRKTGLCALFLTGGFTCIVACIRYYFLFHISVNDVTWTSSTPEAWSIIETNISVVCACLINIAPAIKRIHEAHFTASFRKKIFGISSTWLRRGQRWRYTNKTSDGSDHVLPSIHVGRSRLLNTKDRGVFEIASRSSEGPAEVEQSQA